MSKSWLETLREMEGWDKADHIFDPSKFPPPHDWIWTSKDYLEQSEFRAQRLYEDKLREQWRVYKVAAGISVAGIFCGMIIGLLIYAVLTAERLS